MARRSLSVLALSLPLLIGACAHSVQSSSGADYLARYDMRNGTIAKASEAAKTDLSGIESDLERDIREIASVNPSLYFPARIGIARVERGSLTSIPADEGAAWTESAERLGTGYGEFVPISPLIAEMVSEPVTVGTSSRAAQLVANIRRGAARQHLDYVLVYEVNSVQRDKANALALADLTIIGMFVVPSRTIDAQAQANGLLLDVRNGYPYATLSAVGDETGVSRAISETSSKREHGQKAKAEAVENLTLEFEAALKELAKRAAEAG